MVPKFIKRLFKGRVQTPAHPVPVQPPPTQEDYANEICRRVFRNPECGMMMANIDDDGNIHFSDGFIVPVDQIPRNDSRMY